MKGYQISTLKLLSRGAEVLKFRFSELKKISHRKVFGELQITQIAVNFQTSCCNLKTRALGENLLYYFNFERSYDVLKSKMHFVEQKFKL